MECVRRTWSQEKTESPFAVRWSREPQERATDRGSHLMLIRVRVFSVADANFEVMSLHISTEAGRLLKSSNGVTTPLRLIRLR